MPVISRFLEIADVQIMIMLSFTYIAVASVIFNAMLMSVFERIHEFGIMKAIGVSPWFVVGLVYAETLVQTLVAALLGLSSGSALAFYLQKHGIDMSAISSGFSFAGVALDPMWYAHVTAKSLWLPVVFLFIVAAIAVIYPAAKVALLRPLEAIRHQ
jgi:ABC-type antimicrobial peptide transport system permease subunit